MISFLGLLQVSGNVLSIWFSVFISPYNIFVQKILEREKKNHILSILQRVLDSSVT